MDVRRSATAPRMEVMRLASTPENDPDLDELAAIHDALGHPVRLAILQALREQRTLPMADLRRETSQRYIEIDARGAQFHVAKLAHAGIVSVRRVANRDVVTLLQDVTLKLSPVS